MSDFDFHAENDPEAFVTPIDEAPDDEREPVDFYPGWAGPEADERFDRWRFGTGPGNDFPKDADDELVELLRRAFHHGYADHVARRGDFARLRYPVLTGERRAYAVGRLFAPRFTTRPR